MKFYKVAYAILIPVFLVGCSGQNNQTNTWNNSTIKNVVLSQCVVFTKIGSTNPKDMMPNDANYIRKSMQNGIDFKNLDASLYKKSKCCAEVIFSKYSQEFYYNQSDSTVFIADAIDKCK